MLGIVTVLLLAVVFGFGAPIYRRVREQDGPAQLWGQRWPSTEAAAEALARGMGLTHERRSEGSSWWASLLMAPIWLLWDPMGLSVDSMSRLAPWRLVGARSGGRQVRVEFVAERVQFGLACRSRAFFSAKSRRAGRPFEEQEGLRLMHPIGGPRWAAGIALVEDAFAQSLDSLRLQDDMLFGEMPLDQRGPLPAEYPRLLESLERVAIWLEA